VGLVERREREKLALRQEILNAARDLFVTEGYRSVSMRKIAERIEYSPTTIYLYFKDKTELLHAICEATFTNLRACIAASIDGIEDPLAAMKAGLTEYVHFGLKHPNEYLVVFMSPPGLPEEADYDGISHVPAAGEAFDLLRQAVARCVAAGVFPGRDIETTAQVLFCVVHGLTSNLITCVQFAWVDKEMLIGTTLDAALAGLNHG
jgi:AcrR family transcriptional regulator